MKFLLVFSLVICFAFAQSRPTGGTGPHIAMSDYQLLSSFEYIISERIKENYYTCGISIPKPNQFSIYEVSILLQKLNLLKIFQEINVHQYPGQDCLMTVVPLSTQMSCLLQGTDYYLNIFVNHPYSIQYLQKKFNLEYKEAKDVMQFLMMMKLSQEAKEIIK